MASIEVKREFDPVKDCWDGALDTVNTLDDDELQEVLDIAFGDLEEVPTDTDVNDFLWFENDTIAEWLGYADWVSLEKARSGNNAWKDNAGYVLDEEEIEEMYQYALENGEFDEGDYEDYFEWAEDQGYELL